MILFRRWLSYTLVALPLLFTACRKDDVAAGRDYKTLGTAAHDLLSASSYTTLQVEVSYMPGYPLDAAALDNLKAFLEQHLNKPGGITIVTHAVASSGKSTLSLADLVGLEKEYRTAFTGGTTVAVHVLVADADYTETDNLALSYWNTSFCLFGKTIATQLGGPWQLNRTTMQTALLEHEFGHLLGLVGQGSPEQAPHRDATHGAHCSSRSCLMYYTVETPMATTTVPALDAQCLADLKANGGK